MKKCVPLNDQGMRIGQEHPRAKHTDAQVEAVLVMDEQGCGYKRIARALQMPKSTVRSIIKGHSRRQSPSGFKWVHIPDPLES